MGVLNAKRFFKSMHLPHSPNRPDFIVTSKVHSANRPNVIVPLRYTHFSHIACNIYIYYWLINTPTTKGVIINQPLFGVMEIQW